MIFGPLDPLLAVLYAALKLRRLRTLILFFGLMPAILYSLPPQPCGCFGPVFRRCSAGGRTLAYFAAMKSDLKNLASQEEIYFSDNGTYSVDMDALGFVSSYGVRVTVVATAYGWVAQVKHDALRAEKSCAAFYGVPPVEIRQLDGAEPGELVCTPY